MKLIVGLGNPGKQYEKTRHNVGYMAVNKFAENEKAKFKYEATFMGLIAEYRYGTIKALLLKPVTFMNLSGKSVEKIANYFKIDVEDILVIYDDVDIELGDIKLRYTGSSGGHKGMADIINHLDTKDIKRVRVGIGKDINMIDYVLEKFSKKEMKVINSILDDVCEVIGEFIKGEDFSRIMNHFNK